ncbi:MAG: stage III sporulation protein AG [Lachnospiraceae bacterium]|nr:stage III sporulation protein AG [Lachnospiraceae bacterium]
MKDWKNIWKKKKPKKDQCLILFLTGVLLLVIVFPSSCGESSSGSGETDALSETSDTVTATDYEAEMESRLADILSRMEGVGAVEVMITFQDSGEAVVEKDVTCSQEDSSSQEGGTSDTRTESSEATVFTDSEEEPFVSKEIVPAIEGVLVVAEGGGNSTVASNISEAVEALFGLEAHKIKVVKMENVQEGSE